MRVPLPEHARSLLHHLPEPPATDGEFWPILVERLLEDGDRNDLRWLTTALPEERLAEWLDQRGARRLSRRSCSFWSLLLDREVSAMPSARTDLWPL